MAGFEMRRRVLEEHPRGRVVMVDTIAHVAPEDAGHVVVAGSHGGVSSGEYAARVPVAAVFFNGAKAEEAWRRHVEPHLALERALRFERLPSTSPAHASRTWEAKLACWRAVRRAAERRP